MKVEIVRVNDAFHFQASGESPVKVNMDASEKIGGHNLGSRPMELLLMGLGGCTAIDVILILNKQKQNIEDIKIEVTGEREEIPDTHMSPFKSINIHFILKGNIEPKKLEKAIALSQEKYCSATAQLSCSSTITSSYEIN